MRELVTPEELIDYMSGISLDAGQYEAAAFILRGVTRSLERKLNRRFGVEEDTFRAFTDEAGWARLGRTPVQRILTVGGRPWTPAANDQITPNGVQLGAPLSWYSVTYEGGYVIPEDLGPIQPGYGEDADDELADVRLAIAEKAAQYMTDRHDDARSVKDFDTREPTPRGEFRWTEDEIEPLERMRQRMVW